jgi:hypothetical protein
MEPAHFGRPILGTRARLAGNDPTPASPEECLPTARAFSAVRHFLKHDARPEWLTYRHVK